ncbi:hypothetical protein [Streptomyces fungicidicus]|uniref:hypothetical protein n=1 Tax=Streptomyces fungicidicus TaxID=68203 RepID=UPI0036759977
MTGQSRTDLEAALEELNEEQFRLVSAIAQEISDSENRANIYQLISHCDNAQIRQISNIVSAMLRPVFEDINPASDLVTPPFREEFRARLQAHHGTHDTPLDRLSFENALAAACLADGRDVQMAPSKTTRFWDVRIDGMHTSAKSTSAQNIKVDELHISKLSEAVWIQDCRTARARYVNTMKLFDDFLSTVQKWLVLRAFRMRGGDGRLIYELVEIPMALFATVTQLNVNDFSAEASKIDVVDALGPAFQLVLDRSDSKVTIKKIPKDRCVVHGQWHVEA